ncbi:MAG: amidohydrolase family protein, partial [Acidobacteriota bacterium]|nr:amidohydrolase family protein [Acidobacteriota bacterium]
MDITANIAGEGLARIEIEGPRIKSALGAGPIDPEKPWIAPGFIDIQINGFEGVDFSDPSLDAAKALSVLPSIWRTGVTTFCPTLVTNTLERLERNFQILEQARRLDARFAAAAPCYHLEGPYLSPGGAHGAHDPDLMRNPDWNEFARLQRAAGGNIGIVTLAPELPGACDFIRHAAEAGVITAIGHTDCTPEEIHNAIEAGAKLSTHLGNGCPAFIPRHENPIWAQIADDRLQASLICDGFHLPSDFVHTVYKAKGIGRCILVTDAIHAANLPPG